MANARTKYLCKKLRQCCGQLVTDLNRDRKTSTTPVEMIHQLRVACRQGEALLHWCKKNNKSFKQLKKPFQWIRQQAGPLRDADIVIMQLYASAPRKLTPPWLLLWGLGIHQRGQAAKAWRDVHEKLYRDAARVEKVIDNIRGQSNQHCLALLQKVFDQWYDALQKAEKPAWLHQVRIAAKRLRYALETYPDRKLENKNKWKTWLKNLQDVLGKLRDRQLFYDWIFEAEEYPVVGIINESNWLAFLRSCQKTINKQIQNDQIKIKRMLQKLPEWIDLE